MPVVAVSMMKDERRIALRTVRHMAGEVDALIVADNASTDGTREKLKHAEMLLPLTVVDDPDPAYTQSAKMSHLAEMAAELHDPDDLWIVPFDADELWTAPGGRIRDVLPNIRADIVVARITNHFVTGQDEGTDDPFTSMVWRQAEPQGLGKVAFRWRPGAVIHQGNHGVTLPVHEPRVARVELAIRHFPYRSEDQMLSKVTNGARAYALTDLPPDVGEHWRLYGQVLDEEGPDAIRAWFRRHFYYPDPNLGPGGRPLEPGEQPLVRDPAPYRRWDRFS